MKYRGEKGLLIFFGFWNSDFLGYSDNNNDEE